MLFDSFEAYDVQETRRVSRAEGRKEGRIEGIKEGELSHLIKVVCRLSSKHYSVEDMTELLDDDAERIRIICEVIQRHKPEYGLEEILGEVKSELENGGCA